MKRLSELLFDCYPFFLIAVLTSQVDAENETFADKFLGSPLLILAAALIVALIAFTYHKMRK